MFDGGVFSPFLGLSTDSQALNFHAMLSSLICMGDGGFPACRVSGGWGLLTLAPLQRGWLGLGCWSCGWTNS